MYSFYFHYNRPAALKAGKVKVSLHYRNTCYILDNIVCNVPVKGRIRKIQPKWVMAGKANSINFDNGVAIIN